jgi:transposase
LLSALLSAARSRCAPPFPRRAPGQHALGVDPDEGEDLSAGWLVLARSRQTSATDEPDGARSTAAITPFIQGRSTARRHPRPGRRGIKFTSPLRRDQIAHRRTKGSCDRRPPAFDAELHTDRNVVERCFNRLNQFRDLATRYAKRAA